MKPKIDRWQTPCDADKRWVCGACGRVSEPGTARNTMRDTSCMHWAVLCWAEQRDGRWFAVADDEAVEPGACAPLHLGDE